MLNTQQLKEEFIHRYGELEVECFFAPGRVNLIGEHIDYNGGFVLPAAISLGITAVVRRRTDNIIRVYTKDFEQETSIDLNKIKERKVQENVHWSDYIVAVLLVLQEKNVAIFGADILLGSDLPLGAGLSSSAALECLIAYIFNEDYYTQQRKELALDAQYAERFYVGVNCGIMDQFVVANGKKNHAILLDCALLYATFIPIDFQNYKLIIINSNKSRALAESKYNERRAECDRVFEELKKIDIAENLCTVHEVSLTSIEDEVLYKRAKYAVLEYKRVLLASTFLQVGRVEDFAQLLTQSHISLDKDYEVSGNELNAIIEYSTHFEGCIGARMTGAGFGGCCIALVDETRVDDFIREIGEKYTQKTTLIADFYLCEIVDGVNRIN